MGSEDRDNLQELFGAFMGPEEAREAAEELRAGEEMLRAHPAPEPSAEVLLKIKARGAAELARRHRRQIWRKYASVAAALIVLGCVGLQIFKNQTPSVGADIWTSAIWETDSMVRDDADLAYISAEIDEIEEQFKTVVSPSEETDASASELYEMEMELIAMASDFWKG